VRGGMATTYDPVVDGIRQGVLVKITGPAETAGEPDHIGKLAQVGEFNADASTFLATLLDGTSADFNPKHLELARDLGKPGEGGESNSFDLLLSAQTSHRILGEEIAMCLFEKGFCVLRCIQRPEDSEKALKAAKALGEDGKMFRFAEEVEEHYLGDGATGKCFWLDPDDDGSIEDELLWGYDAGFTAIASLIQPYVEDSVGAQITERSPALLSLPLSGIVEEEDYPNPEATDKALGAFLTTWRRQVLKAVQCGKKMCLKWMPCRS